jgi:hypothetical protein
MSKQRLLFFALPGSRLGCSGAGGVSLPGLLLLLGISRRT